MWSHWNLMRLDDWIEWTVELINLLNLPDINFFQFGLFKELGPFFQKFWLFHLPPSKKFLPLPTVSVPIPNKNLLNPQLASSLSRNVRLFKNFWAGRVMAGDLASSLLRLFFSRNKNSPGHGVMVPENPSKLASFTASENCFKGRPILPGSRVDMAFWRKTTRRQSSFFAWQEKGWVFKTTADLRKLWQFFFKGKMVWKNKNIGVSKDFAQNFRLDTQKFKSRKHLP